MSSEMVAPFQLTPSGGVAVTTSPYTQVQQHLQALVSTSPGERVMRPTYGVPLPSYLFGLDKPQVMMMAQRDVQVAITKWEPNINVQDVRTVLSDTSLGGVAISVDYSPGITVGAGAAQVQTATVLVGGEIITS